MDCPVCKYPNPQGATHCGMCYEVFNRSAAQTYLQAMKRERRMNGEEPAQEPKKTPEVQVITEHVSSALSTIDWSAMGTRFISLLMRSKRVLAVAAGLIGMWMLASFLLNPNLWFHLFGKKLTYAFSEKAPVQYLVGLTQEIRVWSERQGRLDTPMEQYRIEEIGNVLCEKAKSTSKTKTAVTIRAREWIQLIRDRQGSASHSIPLTHPSLARGRITLNKKGVLLDKRNKLTPRLAKGLSFMVPAFPEGSLRENRTWSEPVEWIDIYNDWKFYWKGRLFWTLGELEPCGDGLCAQLSYRAEIRPQMWASPAWASGAVRLTSTNVSTEGKALFDVKHHRLMANSFTYDGLLQLSLKDLGRVPWELRIGKRVKGPGVIVLRFENKIDIRKN